MAELRGLFNALLTPFTSDGEVVAGAVLRTLVDRSIRGGVHGLVAVWLDRGVHFPQP